LLRSAEIKPIVLQICSYEQHLSFFFFLFLPYLRGVKDLYLFGLCSSTLHGSHTELFLYGPVVPFISFLPHIPPSPLHITPLLHSPLLPSCFPLLPSEEAGWIRQRSQEKRGEGSSEGSSKKGSPPPPPSKNFSKIFQLGPTAM